nr:PREDICTED: CMRF35-like molecule 1 [Latimeria chalumnae]|eukprot:XP_014340091.1 PREDICTED: CMRF35-like molecule 1 [Latimeria chalumnae]
MAAMDQFVLLLLLILAAGSEAGSEVVKGTWGGSVILSCRSSNYYPKTWCKMNQWNECSDVVRTDGYKNPSYKGRVQISDSHGLATIIMEQLENSDAGIYWCGTYNTNTVFKLREVILIITQDSRTSPKEVRFPLGGSATVHCRYNKEVYGNHGKVWCKQTKGYYCDSKVYSVENKENTGRTSISDNSTEGAITVTMKQLNTGDAGFYWCGIIISGGNVLLEKIKLHVVPATVKPTVITFMEGPSDDRNVLYKILFPALGLIVLLLAFIAIWILKAKKKRANGKIPSGLQASKPKNMLQSPSVPDFLHDDEDDEGIKYATLELKPKSVPADVIYSNLQPTNKPDQPLESPSPKQSSGSVEYSTLMFKS